jgi:hypothetical protein
MDNKILLRDVSTVAALAARDVHHQKKVLFGSVIYEIAETEENRKYLRNYQKNKLFVDARTVMKIYRDLKKEILQIVN